MKEKQAHDRLYALIPELPFKCIEGCKDCCGPVVCSEWEKSLQPDVPESQTGYCAFAVDGCQIYEDRPLMCRLFGSGRKCPHFDYTRGLSRSEVVHLMDEYKKLVGPVPSMSKGCSKAVEDSVVRAAIMNRPQEFEEEMARAINRGK